MCYISVVLLEATSPRAYGPLCVTVNVWPAMVSVPVWLGVVADPLLGATVKVTVPLPVPEAPPVTVTQLAFDVADHVHVDPVVTVTLPLPPVLGTD